MLPVYSLTPTHKFPMVKLQSPVQAVLPRDTSSKSEGGVLSKCEGRLFQSIMSLSEDLLQDLFSHDRDSIIFVPCLNEEQLRITFGMKL